MSGGNLEKIRWVYGQEEGCDVIFKVGGQENEWRLPAHAFVLKEANVVFRTMVSEQYVHEFPHSVTVPDIDGRAFDNLLRFLYGEPVSLQSVENSLQTLFASHKYRCPGLVGLCVDFLKDELHVRNVLEILSCVHLLSCDYRGPPEIQTNDMENEFDMAVGLKNAGSDEDHPVPSAPPLCESEPGIQADEINPMESTLLLPENFDNIEGRCWELLQDCLTFVDRNAATVLDSDKLEDLDPSTLRLILSRDTLDVPNESVVFVAICRWADKECKRKQLPLTPESKKAVLNDILFLPRYLNMSLLDFQSGPGKSNLFSPSEIQIVTQSIRICFGSQCWATRLSDLPKLRPYLHDGPRRPVRPKIVTQPLASKRKRFRLFKRFKGNKFCCRKTDPNTPTSSNHSSPTHRVNSGSINASRRESQDRFSRFNFIESIFICLACLFD